jgi:hypothetical protein
MVAIKDIVKKVVVRACMGFKYGSQIYETKEKALDAWRYDQIIKLFPYKNCEQYKIGYNACDINNKWDELVAILTADVPVIL